MKALFLLLFIGIICRNTFCQDLGMDLDMRNNPFLPAEINLKDGNRLEKYIRIDTATDLNIKDSVRQKKSNKIDYKSIENIKIVVDSIERTYTYKRTDRDNFLKFVEVLEKGRDDKLEIYVYSPDPTSLFYQGIDRSNVRDYIMPIRLANRGITSNVDAALDPNLDPLQAIESGDQIRKRISSVLAPKYLFGLTGEDKLYDLFSKKRLLKFAETHFVDCPIILEKISKRQLKSEDAIEILEIYSSCN